MFPFAKRSEKAIHIRARRLGGRALALNFDDRRSKTKRVYMRDDVDTAIR